MASIAHNQIVENSNLNAITKQTQIAANGKTNSTSVKSQDFLQLLTMQLQYQDPTNPMDNTDMLAQEAQFTTLEQMEALASNFSKFSNAYQANSFLGQTVEVQVGGKTTVGTVDFVDFSDASGAAVNIKGTSYPISSITKVFPQDSTATQQADEENNNFIQNALSYIGSGVGAIAEKLLGTTATQAIEQYSQNL